MSAASQARRVLGDDGFTRAWDEGQGLTLDDAVAYAAHCWRRTRSDRRMS